MLVSVLVITLPTSLRAWAVLGPSHFKPSILGLPNSWLFPPCPTASDYKLFPGFYSSRTRTQDFRFQSHTSQHSEPQFRSWPLDFPTYNSNLPHRKDIRQNARTTCYAASTSPLTATPSICYNKRKNLNKVFPPHLRITDTVLKVSPHSAAV